MEKILKGYMNNNYKDKNLFIKIMKPVAVNYLGIKNVFNGLEAIKNSDYKLKYILKPIYIENDTKTVISKFEYIEEENRMNLKNIKNYFESIISSLNEIHSLNKLNARSFDESYKIKYFYDNSELKINEYEPYIDEVINIFLTIRSKYDLFLCHNDVNENNFIATSNKFYLIDYDTVGLNTKLFDYVSFITETLTINDKFEEAKEFVELLIRNNNISEDQIEDLNNMFVAQNLLWSLWANYFYNIEKNEIYEFLSKKLYSIFKNCKKIY